MMKKRCETCSHLVALILLILQRQGSTESVKNPGAKVRAQLPQIPIIPSSHEQPSPFYKVSSLSALEPSVRAMMLKF